MEGHGLYLVPYKYGKGLYLGPYKHVQSVIIKKKNVENTLKMPAGATTNIQLNWQDACMYHILEVSFLDVSFLRVMHKR